VILAEAAGAARPGGEIDVFVGHCLRPDALGFVLQEPREVAGHEARRAALPDVGQLAPAQQILLGRRRQDARLVAEVLESGLDQMLGAPVQAPEEDLGVRPLLPGERGGGIGAVVALLGMMLAGRQFGDGHGRSPPAGRHAKPGKAAVDAEFRCASA
jgi:hypothetical protein